MENKDTQTKTHDPLSQSIEQDRSNKKQLRGVVVSKSGANTAKVRVMRYVKHPKYKKFEKKSKNYLVHDEGNTHEIGANVVIEECRPISKMKYFRIIE